jgi:serine/threonine-protein kinase
MIDGDGNVRITDFGLAVATGDAGAVRAGTPQYMAPEQLAGQPATIRSDIFALGLILFEVLTGKRAFDAKTMADLIRQHESGQITTPSSVVRDLDPALERVIMRCLEKDPAKRPASALAVAAALPGANPLADALAAGETPSPELLAAAGEKEALGVGRGLAALAFVAVGMAISVLLAPATSFTGFVPLEKPPAVLADRAQQILASLGYVDPIGDQASAFGITEEFVRWHAEHDRSPSRWATLRTGRPAVIRFWYRSSPRTMAPAGTQRNVSMTDPPLTASGMTLVKLDTRGRLEELNVVPPQFDPGPAAPLPTGAASAGGAAPEWTPLFEAAGLKMDAFTPSQPQWSPRMFADTRAAWEGALPEQPELRVRIEAAAYHGRAVSFVVVGPWTSATRAQAAATPLSQTVLSTLVELMTAAFVAAALLLARHNVRSRRADLRGANRLAVAVIVGFTATWVFAAHHFGDISTEMSSFSKQFGWFLFEAALLWIMYLALEPYVRRFWPDAILGWTRLVSGRVRDPRVGRDILIGCVCAFAIGLPELLYFLLPGRLGAPPPYPVAGTNVAALTGVSRLIGLACDQIANSLFVSLLAVLGIVLLRLIFRRMSIAIAAAFALLMMVQASQVLQSETAWWITGIFQLWIVTAVLFVIVRFGLLATVVTLAIGNFAGDIPLTPNLSHWSATTSNITVAIVVAVACFGYYAARAGEPLFGPLDS